MTLAFVPIVFLAMLLVGVAIVVGLIMLVVDLFRSDKKSARTAGWLIAFSVLVIPVMLVLVSLLSVRQSRDRDMAMERVTAEARGLELEVREYDPGEADASMQAWLPQVDREFEANIYPSLELAAVGLIRRAEATLGDSIKQKSAEPERAAKIHVFSSSSNLVSTSGEADLSLAVEKVVSHLRGSFPTATIQATPSFALSSAQDTRNVQADLGVELVLTEFSENAAPWDRTARQSSGVLQLRLIDGQGESNYVGRFVGKQWVESLTAFESKYHGRHWIVARSPRFANTEFEARRQALQSAKATLLAAGFDESIARAAETGELVVDRFNQRLSRSYGDVWREAVLLDLNPTRLDVILYRDHVVTAQNRSTIIGRLFGFIVLTLIASGLYLVLNAITRGYYRLPVGVVVTAFAILIVLAVLNMA